MAFKLSTMVGENFEIYTSQMARMGFKLSTMVGENFEIYTSQMARMAFIVKYIFNYHVRCEMGYKKYMLVGFLKIQTCAQNTDQIQTNFGHYWSFGLYYRPQLLIQTELSSL